MTHDQPLRDSQRGTELKGRMGAALDLLRSQAHTGKPLNFVSEMELAEVVVEKEMGAIDSYRVRGRERSTCESDEFEFVAYAVAS